MNRVSPPLLFSCLSAQGDTTLRSRLLKMLVFQPKIATKLSKIYYFLNKLRIVLWTHFCLTEKLRGWALLPTPPKYFLYCALNFRERCRRVAVHQPGPTLALLRGGEQALQSYPAWQVGSVLITNRLTSQSPSYVGIWRWLRLPWHHSKRQ